MKSIAYLYSVVGMADLLLTEAGINMGFSEQNGVFAWLMQFGDAWVIAKALGTVFVAFSVLAIRSKVAQDTRLNQALVWCALIFLTALQTAVAFWNAYLLGRL
jgi:hypothetical protein